MYMSPIKKNLIRSSFVFCENLHSISNKFFFILKPGMGFLSIDDQLLVGLGSLSNKDQSPI